MSPKHVDYVVLNNNKKSLYLNKDGKVINTSMDDIEIGIRVYACSR